MHATTPYGSFTVKFTDARSREGSSCRGSGVDLGVVVEAAVPTRSRQILDHRLPPRASGSRPAHVTRSDAVCDSCSSPALASAACGATPAARAGCRDRGVDIRCPRARHGANRFSVADFRPSWFAALCGNVDVIDPQRGFTHDSTSGRESDASRAAASASSACTYTNCMRCAVMSGIGGRELRNQSGPPR